MYYCSVLNLRVSANKLSWTSHLSGLAAGGGGVPKHGFRLLAVLLDDDGPHHGQEVFPFD